MLDLPEEIIALVVSCFELTPAEEIAFHRDLRGGARPGRGDVDVEVVGKLRVLCQLARVSKTFNRISEPLLYRVFPGGALVRTGAYLGALCSRPARCKIVREVVIDRHLPSFQDWEGGRHCEEDEVREYGSEDDDADVFYDALDDELLGGLDADREIAPRQMRELEGSPSPLSRGHMEALRAVVRNVKGSQELRDTLSKYLSRGSEDAVLPLLVLSCSNLETLDICCCPEFHATLTSWALFGTELRRHEDFVWKMGEAHKQNFPRLKTLNIRRAGWAFDNAFTSVAPVLRLPNIESVYVSGTDFRHASQTFKLAWPGITNLEFRGCWVAPRDVETILDACPRLKKLHLSLARAPRFAMNCSHLGDILRSKGQSLTTLEVDTRHLSSRALPETGQDMEHEEGVWGSLGSLKSLRGMKVLIVSTKLLVGPNWSRYDDSADADHQNTLVEARLKDVLPTSLSLLTLLAPIAEEKDSPLPQDLAKQILDLVTDAQYQNLKGLSIQKLVHQELPIACELIPKGWYQKPQAEEIGGSVELVYLRKK